MKHPDASSGKRIAGMLLLAWIGATALFFYLRFSLVFYHANEQAVLRVLKWILP